jgi:hypothetical protein
MRRRHRHAQRTAENTAEACAKSGPHFLLCGVPRPEPFPHRLLKPALHTLLRLELPFLHPQGRRTEFTNRFPPSKGESAATTRKGKRGRDMHFASAFARNRVAPF